MKVVAPRSARSRIEVMSFMSVPDWFAETGPNPWDVKDLLHEMDPLGDYLIFGIDAEGCEMAPDELQAWVRHCVRHACEATESAIRISPRAEPDPWAAPEWAGGIVFPTKEDPRCLYGLFRFPAAWWGFSSSLAVVTLEDIGLVETQFPQGIALFLRALRNALNRGPLDLDPVECHEGGWSTPLGFGDFYPALNFEAIVGNASDARDELYERIRLRVEDAEQVFGVEERRGLLMKQPRRNKPSAEALEERAARNREMGDAVSRIERRSAPPPIDSVVDVAATMGVEPSTLLEWARNGHIPRPVFSEDLWINDWFGQVEEFVLDPNSPFQIPT